MRCFRNDNEECCHVVRVESGSRRGTRVWKMHGYL